MKMTRFPGTSIIKILKVYEADRYIKDLCSENGISMATFKTGRRDVVFMFL
jgi:hypothetical protein